MVFKLKGKEITRRLITLLLVLSIVFSVCVSVMGASVEKIGKTTTYNDHVNVREGPSTDTAILTSIPPQTQFKIIGEEIGQGDYLWYKVEYEGFVGYVRSDNVVIISDGQGTTSPESTTGSDLIIPGHTTDGGSGETTGAPDETNGETTGGETTGSETIPGETIPGETIPGETTDGPSDETTNTGTTYPEETTSPEEKPVIDFEAYMNEQKFPESYKSYLRQLHELYPNWVFKAQLTGYDFDYAVEKQLKVSLVENSFPSSWKSIDDEAYDWATNQWKIYDGDRWVRASKEIIKHYMDPRNFLGADTVFQFLDQSYDPDVQNIEGVKRIIKGTFMEDVIIDSTGTGDEKVDIDYANAIFQAGKDYGINPYVLASMIIIEVGSNGSSIVSGTVPGYVGYYNFFNIGAYSANGMNPVQRGLWYAKGGNNGATSYSRPWNTRLKAIRGGAQFYSDGYVTAGQNTLYLKRYNVQGDNAFTHQYMTSVYGAALEATKLAKGYSAELRESALTFCIPVFENMPEEACPAPTLDGSPNMKLSSINVEGFELTPEFDTEVLEYMLVVPPVVSSVKVNAVPMDSSAKVEGIGEITLNMGTNIVEIKVTAGNGTVRVYKLTIAKEDGGENFGQLTFTDKYVPKNNIVYSIVPGMIIGDFRKAFVVEGFVEVKSKDGTPKTDDDTISTGDVITVTSTGGVKYADYTASVLGDVNGDGKVNISDLLRVRNRILGTEEFVETQQLSGDIDGSGTINISDLLKVRNHILGTVVIS